MRKNTQHWLATVVLLAAGVTTLLVGSPCLAADHPRLVSLESTNCNTCHAKLTRGFETVHAPVADDCTSCHDMTIGSEGTTVELGAPEPDLCLMCHDSLEAQASGDIETPHAPVTDSCLSCHEVHAGAEASLLVAPLAELCTSCHDVGDLAESHSGQLIEGVNCASCHVPHGSPHPAMLQAAHQHAPFADGSCDGCHRPPAAGRIRLQARGQEVCTACHGGFAEEAGDHGSVHKALEGTRRRAGCLSCHNPHMSPRAKLLVDEGVELCGQCHGDVLEDAQADTGHAPVADDCTSCHQPHVSANPALLAENPPDLCLMCHDAEDEDLIAAHLGANLSSLDCVACHSPHGAGNEKLLARTVHPPVLDDCDTCHEGSHKQLVEDGESTLCLACHDDIGEYAASATHPHPVMEMARCADCHNPHASPQDKLILEPAGGVCTVCHEDQAAGSNEFVHSVIESVGCRACHEPHGSSNTKLLRLTGSELCLSCHDRKRVQVPNDAEMFALLDRFPVSAEVARATARLDLSAGGEHGHPMADHRVLGTPTEEELEKSGAEFTGEMTCLTCHDPHKSASKHLFKGAAGSTQLCSQCHTK
jgi:predicted CXXCH cytochrome family protein